MPFILNVVSSNKRHSPSRTLALDKIVLFDTGLKDGRKNLAGRHYGGRITSKRTMGAAPEQVRVATEQVRGAGHGGGRSSGWSERGGRAL